MAKRTRKIRGWLTGQDIKAAREGKPTLTLIIWKNPPTNPKIKSQEVDVTFNFK